MPAARGLRGERADHVVGLHAFDHQQRPAMRAHEFVQRRDLRDEVVGHRRPVRLVLRVPVVAERLARRVEHDGEVVRLAVIDHSAQHRKHAAQRAGRLALRGAQIGKRVKRAVQVRRPVHQHERRHASDPQDSGTHRSARTQHDQRPGSVAGAGDYGRVRHRDRAAARHPSRRQHLRQRAHQGRPPVLREDEGHRAPAVRRRLLRDLRRRPRHHAGGQRGRARRLVAGGRSQHHAAVRAERQRVPGRLRRLPLFLRAQDDVRALRVRVRHPARRLRHARRAVRSADARADRQEPPHSGHPRRRRLLARPPRRGWRTSSSAKA